MKLRFPIPMTIRCYQCGKVHDVVFTSGEPHEFPCPACGKVEVYHLSAIMKKLTDNAAKMMRTQSGFKEKAMGDWKMTKKPWTGR